MPKGNKKSLLESDLPVVTVTEEEGSIPFFLIDDTHGVYANQFGYDVVELKQCNRTVKGTDTEPEYIETFPKWDGIGYVSTFSAAIEFYLDIKERELNKRQVKTKDYKQLIKVQEEIREICLKAFDAKGENADVVSFAQLFDYKAKMLKEIDELKNMKLQLEKEFEQTMDYIKEKRKIVRSNTEPKKHRNKLEE